MWLGSCTQILRPKFMGHTLPAICEKAAMAGYNSARFKAYLFLSML